MPVFTIFYEIKPNMYPGCSILCCLRMLGHMFVHVRSTSEILRTMPALLRALCLRDVDFAAGVGSACSQHLSHTVI